ncbi:MAG: serine/threonine protein kinase [Thermomicrobiales bacterium]|nr:serine/threonine protein kinase [Thermomicrobiales bacterium]
MVAKDVEAGSGAGARATVGGRYDIDLARPIAAGGLCLVYRGFDRRTRATVAARTLRVEYRNDPDIRARFRREARLVAFLNHPNIVRVEAFVEERSTLWVILEFVEGRTLRDIIAERAPLSPEEIVPILDQAASALGHIHEQGLVHLDIKPENLLVTEDGVLKLIDLGLAQPAGRPQEAAAGRTVATAAYLAPEQACGDPVDGAADLYALACVAYELLTGRPPFVDPSVRQTLNDVITARLHSTPLPPSEARPDLNLPPWIDDAFTWALARDPGMRYSDAPTFARLYRSGVEGDLAVELPQPQQPLEATHRPLRRTDNQWATTQHVDRAARAFSADEDVRDAGAGARPTGAPGWSQPRIDRLLWLAVGVLALLDLAVGGALLATRGELPPFVVGQEVRLEPGADARVVGDGLLVRAAPAIDGEPLGSLPAGTRLRLDEPPVAADGHEWGPVTFSLGGDEVHGYIGAEWLAPVR